MNEKKVILDWMEWYLGFKPSYEMIQSVNTYMTDKGCQKETQEKDPEWFLNTHWTENTNIA